jgi:hypothetical protein
MLRKIIDHHRIWTTSACFINLHVAEDLFIIPSLSLHGIEFPLCLLTMPAWRSIEGGSREQTPSQTTYTRPDMHALGRHKRRHNIWTAVSYFPSKIQQSTQMV